MLAVFTAPQLSKLLGLSSARPREIAARIIKKQPVLTAETVVADAFGLGDLVPFKGGKLSKKSGESPSIALNCVGLRLLVQLYDKALVGTGWTDLLQKVKCFDSLSTAAGVLTTAAQAPSRASAVGTVLPVVKRLVLQPICNGVIQTAPPAGTGTKSPCVAPAPRKWSHLEMMAEIAGGPEQ